MATERIITGINTPEDLQNCKSDSFNFHILKKAAVRMVIKHLHPPQHWVDNLQGNAKIDYELFQEYLAHERQQDRRVNLEHIIPWIICLMAYDENYREVGEFLRYRMFQRRHEYAFSHYEIFPNCWFQDGRGRLTYPPAVLESLGMVPVPWKDEDVKS
jgi:hypothetical protein